MHIARKPAGFDFRLVRNIGSSAFFHFFVGNTDVDRSVGNINVDDVPFFDKTDFAAAGCFRRDMTDRSAAGRAGEPAVGNQRHGLVKLHAGKRRSRVEHFTHTGAADRAFVTDNNDVAVFDSAVVNRVNRFILAVKHAGGACVHQHFGRDGAAFNHTAVFRDIAPQNGDAAGFAVRIVNRANRIGIFDVSAFDVFADGFAGDGHQAQIQKTFLRKLRLHSRYAAGVVEVVHVCGTCGRQVAKVRHFCAHFVKGM